MDRLRWTDWGGQAEMDRCPHWWLTAVAGGYQASGRCPAKNPSELRSFLGNSGGRQKAGPEPSPVQFSSQNSPLARFSQQLI